MYNDNSIDQNRTNYFYECCLGLHQFYPHGLFLYNFSNQYPCTRVYTYGATGKVQILEKKSNLFGLAYRNVRIAQVL